MPGYHLLEQSTPPSASVSDRPCDRLGFLDFLRELGEEEPGIPRYWEATVVGLEELLFADQDEAVALALDIRRRLRAAASVLQNRLVDVNVVFQGKLQRGDDLWVEYRGARLPVGHIFGCPMPRSDPHGRATYFVGFGLTNGN